MILRRLGLAVLALLCVSPAFADPPPATAPAYRTPTSLIPVAIYDAAGNIISSFGAGGGSGGGATGSVTPAGTNGTSAQAIQGINGGINVGVSATSWPLPTGAATAANQATANSSLASIDGKLPALVNGGQPVTVLNQPATGVTRTRTTCTLPAYASGGNIVCTDQAGQQTTTACAANTACQILPANPSRRTFFIMNRTTNATVDYGYSAAMAPGTGIGIDGSAAAGGQGAGFSEVPAHLGAYFAAAPAPATVVVVQGQ